MSENIKPKFKAVASDFRLHLGVMTIVGKAYPIRKSEKSGAGPKVEVKFASPLGNPVNRVWRDAVTLAVHEEGELKRQVISDGKSVILDASDVKAQTASDLPKNIMTVTVHNAEDVQSQVFSTADNAYIFAVDPKDPDNVKWHNIVVTALRDNPNKVLMGLCNFNNAECVFKLDLFRGYLIFQKQLTPDEINQHPDRAPWADVRVTPERVAGMAKLFDKWTVPFDPADYKKSILEKRAALVNFVPSDEAIGDIEADVVSTMDALFEQMLAD